jgi:hypothetical protein
MMDDGVLMVEQNVDLSLVIIVSHAAFEHQG